MNLSALRRMAAMIWPHAHGNASPQLEAAAARYMETADGTQKAAFDLIDETVDGGSPPFFNEEGLPEPLAKRIEVLTDEVVARMRSKDVKR